MFKPEYHSKYEKYPAFSRCLRARPACAHSSLQAGGEFVMSRCHTRESIVGARKRPYFLTFSFIFARFACFGGFVSAVSFRCFGF